MLDETLMLLFYSKVLYRPDGPDQTHCRLSVIMFVVRAHSKWLLDLCCENNTPYSICIDKSESQQQMISTRRFMHTVCLWLQIHWIINDSSWWCRKDYMFLKYANQNRRKSEQYKCYRHHQNINVFFVLFSMSHAIELSVEPIAPSQ